MQNPNIKNKFLERYNNDPELRGKLTQAVERIHQITKENSYPTGEEFENTARSSFLLINELIINETEGASVWQKKLELFLRTMKKSTAVQRPDDEANLLSQFWDLAQFGYSLVIADEAESELACSIMWSGARKSYSHNWEVPKIH